MDSRDERLFYTSGRTSNEAAFLYQLIVRSFGTNNLPDCSNMCHESSGTALTESIGVGKGSVTVDADLDDADLIVIAGQNPGTNHPRMLSVLEKAKANGAKMIAINPLPEAGLLRFNDPRRCAAWRRGVAIADEFLQIRIGGDRRCSAAGEAAAGRRRPSPRYGVDQDFIEAHCGGFDDTLRARASTRDRVAATGLPVPGTARDRAGMMALAERTIVCWAMGLTQHTHAVATIAGLTNLLLLRGMIGKPGAGVCPVRGHSNVQGDRTMGIWEKMPESFLAALDSPVRHHQPRAARIRRRRRDSGDALPTGIGVHRHGRQLRLRDPRQRGHRGCAAQLHIDGAGVDQAQPQSSGHAAPPP